MKWLSRRPSTQKQHSGINHQIQREQLLEQNNFESRMSRLNDKKHQIRGMLKTTPGEPKYHKVFLPTSSQNNCPHTDTHSKCTEYLHRSS